MIIKYSCKLCGIKRREVQVKPRDPRNQSVTSWMESIMFPLQFDHEMQSPSCPAKELSELMIPFAEDANFVGEEADAKEDK